MAEDTMQGGEADDRVDEVIAHVADRDWFLADIVRLANLGLGIGVTLTVGGATISGTLIGGKDYFDRLSKAVLAGKPHGFSEGDGTDILKTMSDLFQTNGQRYVKPEGADERWSTPEPHYIHLADAKVYLPGAHHPIPNNGLLWRGKLNAVEGFAIGNFS